MKTVNKFVLIPDQHFTLIPSDTILSISSQGDDIIIHALVDKEDTDNRPFDFRIYSANQEIDIPIDNYQFLGTVKLKSSSSEHHVFYKSLSSSDM